MKKETIFELLKDRTHKMFSDEFYDSLAVDILAISGSTSPQNGYVYFIRGDNTRAIKIGKAQNLQNRLCRLNTTMSTQLFLIGYIESERYGALEKEIHEKFKDARIKGEWFSVDDGTIMTEFKDSIRIVGTKLKNILFDDGEIINFKKPYEAGDSPEKYKNEIKALILKYFSVPKNKGEATTMTGSEIRSHIPSMINSEMSHKMFGSICKSIFGNRIGTRRGRQVANCYRVKLLTQST